MTPYGAVRVPGHTKAAGNQGLRAPKTLREAVETILASDPTHNAARIVAHTIRVWDSGTTRTSGLIVVTVRRLHERGELQGNVLEYYVMSVIT